MPPARGSNVTSVPIQRTIFSGSVKNGKTVSGLASIRTSRSTTSVSLGVTAMCLSPLLLFGLVLELSEALLPEAFEEAAKLGETLGPCSIDPACALTPLAHKAGVLQHGQVLRDGGPGDLEVGGNLASGELAVTHQAEDLAPARF